MTQINYEIQISSRSSPMVILSETIVDDINEKMPQGKGQGGEDDETDTNRLSCGGDLQPVMAGLDISREAKEKAREQESVCGVFQRSN